MNHVVEIVNPLTLAAATIVGLFTGRNIVNQGWPPLSWISSFLQMLMFGLPLIVVILIIRTLQDPDAGPRWLSFLLLYLTYSVGTASGVYVWARWKH